MEEFNTGFRFVLSFVPVLQPSWSLTVNKIITNMNAEGKQTTVWRQINWSVCGVTSVLRCSSEAIPDRYSHCVKPPLPTWKHWSLEATISIISSWRRKVAFRQFLFDTLLPLHTNVRRLWVSFSNNVLLMAMTAGLSANWNETIISVLIIVFYCLYIINVSW